MTGSSNYDAPQKESLDPLVNKSEGDSHNSNSANQDHRLANVMTWATVVIAFSAVINVAVVLKQWQTMVKSSDFALRSIELSESTQRTTQQALEATQRALEISERPWLAMKGNKGSIPVGGQITIEVTVVNGGRSSAQVESAKTFLFLQGLVQPRKTEDYFDRTTVGPGQTVRILLKFGSINVNEDLQSAIKSGEMILRLEAILNYRDAFENSYALNICQQYDAKQILFVSCEIEAGETTSEETGNS